MLYDEAAGWYRSVTRFDRASAARERMKSMESPKNSAWIDCRVLRECNAIW